MEGEDYRIKYLKYKQKYTNALQNMQCGGKNTIDALNPQPKAVYIIPKEAYEKLKILGIPMPAYNLLTKEERNYWLNNKAELH